ncbi:McrB family protein [Dialister pneumosintes]|jgi:GTPase subunit of restriction endonuclease|uniref:Restriction endonuclease n=1 Tax=Dialister pneumosintes TaxID=39950 RepID=A0ABX9ME89_9FIRM|nr:restriction endonuclease [Dialister pneumosintes]MBS6480468.1 restriction endonuclease [Dialister sp.]RID94618.1 restriction endonuclease [Dialister pneumosintes]
MNHITNERIYSSLYQADGRVLGRIKSEVKVSRPGEGKKDYRFFVEALSPLPEEFKEMEEKGLYFTGFMNQLGYGFNMFDSEEEASKVLEKKYGNCLITFTPVLKNFKYFVITDIVKEFKNFKGSLEETYYPVPVFGDEKNPVFNGDIHKFCMHVLSGKPLPGLSKKHWVSQVEPPFVIAHTGNYDNHGKYRFLYLTPAHNKTFKEAHIGEGGAYFDIGNHELSYGFIDLSDKEYNKEIIRCHEDPLWFIPENLIEKIRKQSNLWLSDEKIIPCSVSHDGLQHVNKDSSTSMPIDIPSQKILDETVQLIMAETTNEIGDEKDSFTSNNTDAFSEQEFIAQFLSCVEQKGFLYDKKDLYNFHVAAKSSKLLILSGMSGIGKSALVRLYGEALGLSASQMAFLPVRPSWMDDGDILGYLDKNSMLYYPSDTGLAELLVEASKHPEKMYMVCFDEMNLARVEHYFAQFISVLEKKDSRKIQLYNPSLENRVHNSHLYPAQISIGDNVLFMGTVNMDESTYHFSDKVLDRANVITLHQRKFADMKSFCPVKDGLFVPISADAYRKFRVENKKVRLSNEELELLDALNEALQESRVSGGIGYRVAFDIDRYVENIPSLKDFTRGDGLDLQIVQRILTKVRGSREQLQTLLSMTDDGKVGGKLMDLFATYKNVSSFTESKKVLMRKAKELKLYDYTI